MTVNVKLILLGDQGVGKTSLLVRFHKNIYRGDNKYEATVVDSYSQSIQVQGIDVKLIIFDTAGQERFKSIGRSYFHHADGVLLVYDVLEPTSFHVMQSWFEELKTINETAEVLVVGNKIDICEHRVAISMVENFCNIENLEFMEASAKTNLNVEEVFHRLVEKVLYKKGILTREESEERVADEEATNQSVVQLHDCVVLSPSIPTSPKKKKCC